jgi:hypothetical protein
LDQHNCYGIRLGIGHWDFLAFSADGKRIMMGTDSGVVVIVDAVTGAEVFRLVGVR